MVRDDEIQRLISYIKGLGLKVSFVNKEGDDAAFWSLDNSEIMICKNKNLTKIDTILSLIHEVGHALHNIHEKNRKIDPRFENALDHIDEANELEMDTHRRQRKVVLDNEIAGTQYWHAIYKETNMKFPVWKLEAQMEFDLWQYEVFYETGSYPKRKDRISKWKEIEDKHRSNND